MINLKIDPEFQSQIPPLANDEFKQLEENILKEGKLISPLIVWNNTLVDGHNRYAILQKHPEIYFSTMPLRFENREEAIAWICRNQLGRRNLSPEQKRYLLGKQYEAEKKAAKIFRGNQYTLAKKSGGDHGDNHHSGKKTCDRTDDGQTGITGHRCCICVCYGIYPDTSEFVQDLQWNHPSYGV